MKKISSIALIACFAITIVLTIMFFAVGAWVEVPTTTGGITETSPNTDIFLYWVYAIVVVGVIALVLFAVKTLITMFQTNAKEALMALGGVAAFALLLIVCYFASPATEFSRVVNGETQTITESTMKMVDMWLYAIYTLLALTVLLVAGFGIKNIIQK